MRSLLGHLDAENVEERERLDRNFVYTESIRQAANYPFPFVSGRKGSGKSTVANFLLSSLDSTGGAIHLSAEDYEDIHGGFLDTLLRTPGLADIRGRELSSIFYRIWKYLFEVSALHIAVDIAERSAHPQPRVVSIKRYLASQGGKTESPAKLTVFQITGLLARVSKGPSAALEFGQALDRLCSQQHFREALSVAEGIINRSKSLIILDTLEQYDISELRLFSFQGLVRAVKTFYDQKPIRGLSVRCFLPAEMTEHVYAENVAKYKSITSYLEWTYAELLHFLGRRYSNFLEDRKPPEFQELGKRIAATAHSLSERNVTSNSPWREQLWCAIGPDKINNKVGVKEDALGYFLRHTQMRPREVLCAANHVLQAGLDNLQFPHFTQESIVRGVHNSENLDILLSTSLAVFTLTMTTEPIQGLVCRILANEPRVFRANALRRMTDRAMSEGLQPSASAEDLRQEIQRTLFRSGLIGVVALPIGEMKSSSGSIVKVYKTNFEYCVPGFLDVNERSVLAMHPVLADRLGAGYAPPEYGRGIIYHSVAKHDIS